MIPLILLVTLSTVAGGTFSAQPIHRVLLRTGAVEWCGLVLHRQCLDPRADVCLPADAQAQERQARGSICRAYQQGSA